MEGFTIVLIDSKDGSEGDFVYVEAFDTFEDIIDTPQGSYPEWVDRLVQAAHEINERDKEEV